MINRVFKKYLSDIGQKIIIGELTITLPNNENLKFFGKEKLEQDILDAFNLSWDISKAESPPYFRTV